MNQQADVVIICALSKESDAFLRYLEVTRTVTRQMWTYIIADVSNVGGKPVTVALQTLHGMGSVQAGIATTQAILDWQPYYIILAGIAGGYRGSDRKLGDLVIAEQIVGYELGKLRKGVVQRRYQVLRPAFDLVQCAYRVESSDWKKRIKVARPKTTRGKSPKIHYGAVASGEKVVADSSLMTELALSWSKLIGIEMEAFGTALAAHQAANPPGMLMVKGICDWADASKNDIWQDYAADVAAAFTIELIKDLHVYRVKRLRPIKSSKVKSATHPDADIVRFLQACFRRPAFNVPFKNEFSQDDFAQAIEDTITALNTGALVDRVSRNILRTGKAVSDLRDSQISRDMDKILNDLKRIVVDYHAATQSGNIDVFKDRGTYYRRPGQQVIVHAFDIKRIQILEAFNSVCQRVGVPPLTIVLARQLSDEVDYLYPRSKPIDSSN